MMVRLVIACLALYLGLTWEVHALSDEKGLIKHLLANYGRVGLVGRPVFAPNDTLTLNLRLSLINLLKLDEERQTISLLTWYKMEWKDVLLQWDPADFGNVDNVRVPASQIFTPDIMPYFEIPGETVTKKVLALVKSDGTVLWYPPVKMTTLCPGLSPGLDEVTCKITLGSWVEHMEHIDIKERDSYIELDYYVPNSQWDLVEATAKREVKYFPCCVEGYVEVTFSFTFKRGLERAGSNTVDFLRFSLPTLLLGLLLTFM